MGDNIAAFDAWLAICQIYLTISASSKAKIHCQANPSIFPPDNKLCYTGNWKIVDAQ